MHTRQSQGIKEVINDFPEIAGILQEYGIECATCTVGICQLKDVLEIHSLPEDQARALMTRLESVLSGDTQSTSACCECTSKPSSPEDVVPSDAIGTLMREHTFIKRFISIAPHYISNLDLVEKIDQAFAKNCLEFITCYADRLHHGKEEEILFHYFDTSENIFQVMLEEHMQGRTLVSLMRKNILNKETREFTTHFLKYRDLLTEHINKEDTILFPWLDRRMTVEQKRKIQFQFEQSDGKSHIGAGKFEDFVQQLEDSVDSAGLSVNDENISLSEGSYV
jgi:hemerythrin-like domain-containing protein